ncbi:MAG: hypothetical protein JSR41_23660 [Proteobacteria bacterium]|nr:hypothetical protein [Pseudomonadota bacterium]
MTDWMMVAAAVAALALVGAWIFWRLRRGPKETPTVALVRRRRELQSRLQDLAGPESDGLVRQEAQRMHSSPMDLQVLEAAIARAEKLAATRR